MTQTPFKHYTENKEGRDFVVGDIHGMFEALENLLSEIGFEPAYDRVFAVGDLIDRGPQSNRVLEFLNQPWFYSIKGNHEIMLIESEYDRNMFRSWTTNNGGEWWLSIPPDAQTEIRDRLTQLPIVIEVSTSSGKIGLVHADIPTGMTWGNFVSGIQTDEELCNYVLWSRNRIRHYRITNSTDRVEDVDLVVLGHTPVEHPIHISNICYLDTGATYNRKGLGKLSVLEIQPHLKLHQINTNHSRSWLHT
jgi:serine/threonine protein phosphatase 1